MEYENLPIFLDESALNSHSFSATITIPMHDVLMGRWSKENKLFRRIRECAGHIPSDQPGYTRIEIVDGSQHPTVITEIKRELFEYTDLGGIQFQVPVMISERYHIIVGREWIKQNATEEEFADYVAERMLK